MPLKRVTLKTKLIQNSKEPKKLRFVGYTGSAVDLTDYGFDAPVIYDLDTLTVKNQKIPIKYNHRLDIGETTRVENTKEKVVGEGILTKDNKVTKKIENSKEEGTQYESSMGLDVSRSKVLYFKNGVTINGKKFSGQHYVIKHTLMDEITVTPEGRDSNTEVHMLSKLTRQELSKIKEPTKVAKKKVVNSKPIRTKVVRDRVLNQDPVKKVATFGELLRLNNQYPDYVDIIAEGADRGYSFKKIESMVKLQSLEDQLPAVPKINNKKEDDILEARVAAALCSEPEKTLTKKYGEKIADRVLNMPQISLKETMVICASRYGQRFSGHSDTDALVDFLGRANSGRIQNTAGFSSFSMPNLFMRATQLVVEEAWKIDESSFFAQTVCTPLSHDNFQPVERVRPSGGQIWEGLDANGRIKHAHFGKAQRYLATLDTKAQMVTFNRETIENDSFGFIKEAIDLMIEGALIVPDVKLVERMLQQTGTFFKTTGTKPNHYNLALTRDNLWTVYLALQNQEIEKGRVNWLQQIADQWWLIIPPALEKTAWDIIKQDKIIDPTVSVGEKNFFAGRFEIKKFQQLANTSIHEDASDDTWFLWPRSTKYAPFAISYFKGRRRPIMRTAEAPIDMLGFSVAGVFDVEINDREPHAIARSAPTANFTS